MFDTKRWQIVVPLFSGKFQGAMLEHAVLFAHRSSLLSQKIGSIHVGEALATGRTNIVPGDVAAAAQSAALDMLRCHEQMTIPG
nr:hypothetical protein [Tanacetum cinerariifolium]